MTLVELMVAVAVTGLVMTLSLTIFSGQVKSFKRGQETKESQETNNICLELLKRDLAQAGWSVKPEMGFFFKDGGNSTADEIYINDTTLIDLNSQNGTRLMTQADGCGGCAEVTAGSGSDSVTVSRLDINEDPTENPPEDFRAQKTHYVISDLTSLVPGVNKVARITTSAANPLVLDRNLGGSYVAPAVYYFVDTGHILKRSDRSSGGAQPFAANVVDLQVAYRDMSGNWYGVSGCAGTGVGPGGGNPYCSMNPFDPYPINLIRLTLVTRTADPLGVRNDLKYCRPAIENRSAATIGAEECGFIYRSYTVTIRPRNTGN